MTWRTKFFDRSELLVSDSAARLGISNEPSAIIDARLHDTAQRMDAVRSMLAKPVIVSSGYRSPALNKAIGGSTTSHHCQGYAVDFICPGFGSPLNVAREIEASGIKFDQLIYEGTWVHISFAPQMRRQCLTARFGKATTYEKGLNP